MLDFDFQRPALEPVDAATCVLLRDDHDGVRVFTVVRHPKSSFLARAVVFPGGKLDRADFDPQETGGCSSSRSVAVAENAEHGRALAIAACRETFEEALLLLARPNRSFPHEALVDWRRELLSKTCSFAELLDRIGIELDLDSLVPLARWVTPIGEKRRYDTRFYLGRAPEGQLGAHDDYETTGGGWARPDDLLLEFERGRIDLAPPTHRTLELLAPFHSVESAIAWANTTCLEPICPKLIEVEDTMALVLPGDPDHEVHESRIAGRLRFVRREGRWLPEDPPAARLQRPSE